MRKNLPCCRKSSGVSLSNGAPKCCSAAKTALRLRRRGNDDIQVLGGTRLGVEGDSIAANYKIPNASRVEDGQEFFEFVEHLVRALSCDRERA